MINWQEQVISLIIEYYKTKGIRYKAKPDVQKCLIDFMNLDMKLIKPIPRIVFKSNELKTRPLKLQYSKALHDIEIKIRQGEDITFHQGREILDPTFKDDLLNEWIIHHIHLSNTKVQKGQRFYDRSKYLLFVAFSPNQAFFIDVRDHNEDFVFAKKELLEIMCNNWPQIMEGYIIEDMHGLSHDYNAEEISTYRKKGLTVGMTQLSDKVLMNPGTGISTTGHNIHVVRRATSICRLIHEALEQIDLNLEDIKSEVGKEVGYQVKELDLCMQRVDKWPFFRVYEKTSKLYIDRNY